VHLCTIQIIHQPDATIFQFIILTFVYSSSCFGRFPAHHQELNDCSGSLWFYLRIVVTVVLCCWSGRPVGRLTNEIRQSWYPCFHRLLCSIRASAQICSKAHDFHESVHRDTTVKVTNKMQLCRLTLILLTWNIGRAPNNASKWQM
jgi:hypothetical protein